MANFYSKYQYMFSQEAEVQRIQNISYLVAYIEAALDNVETPFLVNYQTFVNQNGAQKNQNQSQSQPPSPGARIKKQHKYPQVEATSLSIGGGGSQEPSPRRARALVTGVPSSDLDRSNQLGSLLNHPQNEDYQSQKKYVGLLSKHQNNKVSAMAEIGKSLVHGSQQELMPAGLSAVELEKIRDLKMNFAGDSNRRRWQQTIENERGGVFDREENSGVKKSIFIPASQQNLNQELHAQFQRNKHKHQSHIYRFDGGAPTQRAESDERDKSPVKIEQMSPRDRQELVGTKLAYIPQSGSQLNLQNPYELALKRRHGAKKLIEQRQSKLKCMITAPAREYY